MLHYWNESWALDVKVCPCDAHFVEFLEDRGIRGASIFHFGTGSHHLVGIRTAESGRDNAVLGITASPGEYQSYVELAIARPEVTRTYKAFFGDIYQLDARLLPDFDVVTLFHLCEFRTEKNDAYGALGDLAMASLLVDRMKPGGWLLFYTGSMAYDRAKPVIERLQQIRPLEAAGTFKTLRLLRKRA